MQTPGTSWRVTSVLGIVQILAWGSSYYLLAVLAAPIAADTGWRLSWIVGGLSLGLLVAGLISPRVGRIIGEFGGRGVLAVSAALLGLGLLILALSPNFAVFLAGWLVLGAGMGCGLYDAAFATLGSIYRERARPAITQLTLWGGFASTVCWPLSAYFVEHLGWRGACLAYAAIQFLVLLPLLLWRLPSAAVGATARAVPPAGSVALKPEDRVSFLLIAGIVTIGGAVSATISVHLLTLLQASGASFAAAVFLGTLIGPAQVVARLIEMASGGRHHPIWTLASAVVLIAMGLVLLWLDFPLPAVPLVLYGAGNGIYSIGRGTVPLTLFGPDRYAALMGRLALPSFIAQATAPTLGAFVLTTFGPSSVTTLLMTAGICNALIILMLAAHCTRTQLR